MLSIATPSEPRGPGILLAVSHVVSKPLRGQVDTAWLKAFTINYIFRLFVVALGSQVNKDSFSKQDISGA